MNNHKLKLKLISACNTLLENKRIEAEQLIQSAEDARNNETKSSAGDKYETGRAMMQIERDKAEYQLNQILALQNLLNKTKEIPETKKVRFGSLVFTDEANYFISIPLGKVILNGIIYYAISQDSPIGKAMIGSAKGDLIHFNNRTIQLLDVI